MSLPTSHATSVAAASSGGCPVDHAALAAVSTPSGCPVSARAAAFDPFEDGYQQNPPEYVRWAREQEPIFFSPKLGYWVVTRYDDIKAIFRDNLTFSPSNALERLTPPLEEANQVLASYGYAMNRTLVNEDEPAHMARRRLLMEPFTPEALKHHEPMVRQVTRTYMDRFINSGRADLVDQMLWEVPLTIAMHFLGVPEEDMDQLRRYSIAHTVNTWGRPRPEEQLAVAHAVGNFWQLSGKILEKMRANPDGTGWMNYCIRQQKDFPEIVTDSFLHSMMMAGIVAAHETTANATANAVKLLLQHPSAWQELCDDPTLIQGAVEECLRYTGSVAAWRRIATQDTTVGGMAFPAGAKFLIVMASANHDERHFPDADLFDIRRDNASDHLTFGYGSHQCMGKNLARMELQIFLEEFTKRLPHMRLSEQTFSYVPNTSFRGPEHLWVEWDVRCNPEARDPTLLTRHQPLRIGEPARHGISRTVAVQAITPLTGDIVKLRLVPLAGQSLPRWSPGSHIDVVCGSAEVSRQYSLCSDPADTQVLEIAVLRDPQSRGGSAWIHEQLRVGDKLKIRGPRNHFRFDEGCAKAIFVAGGIGITPVATMAQRARALGLDYEIHYSGRSRASMALLAELQAQHGERLQVYAKDEGRRADYTRLLATPRPGAQVYACGPVRMLDALAQATAAWPEDSLHVEHFQATRATLDPSREHGFEVELKDSGIVLQVPANQTLLSVLRHASIDLQSDCGEGLCGSCEVQVLAGEVDHRDTVLTRAERQTHAKMMVCCSRACGDRLVLAL